MPHKLYLSRKFRETDFTKLTGRKLRLRIIAEDKKMGSAVEVVQQIQHIDITNIK